MSDEIYELAIPEPPPNLTLFGAGAAGVIEAAAKLATPLAELIRKQRLSTNIRGREHVRVEGWTLLGSMLGVFPVVVWTKPLEDGWEARVEARTLSGAVVGAGEAECRKSERTWSDRDSYALRSMAQTRATSKAMRLPLGFVMSLAGFDPTPAEEIPAEEAGGHQKATTATTLPQDGPNGSGKPATDPEVATKKAAVAAIVEAYQGISPAEAKRLAAKHWVEAVETSRTTNKDTVGVVLALVAVDPERPMI